MNSNSLDPFSVVRVSGGVGNQLFQLGFAYSLETKTGEPVYLDTVNYREGLEKLERRFILGEILGSDERLINSGNSLRHILQKLESSRISAFINHNEEKFQQSRYRDLKIARQAPCVYDAELSINPRSYFIGSFTSPQYWGEKKDTILQKVADLVKGSYANSNDFSTQEIGVLAIHARRGDYISNEKTNKIHGSYGLNYYIEAVRQLVDFGHLPSAIIISSDSSDFSQDLATKLDRQFRNIRIIDNENLQGLMLTLSGADYFIGSNSTFSWWVSHLRERKFSILPLNWFRGNSYHFDPNGYFLNRPFLLDFDFDI